MTPWAKILRAECGKGPLYLLPERRFLACVKRARAKAAKLGVGQPCERRKGRGAFSGCTTRRRRTKRSR